MRWLFIGMSVGCAAEAPVPTPVDDNARPAILSARIDCDGEAGEETWVLFAEVADPDGLDDVLEVTALVYDEATNALDETHVLVRLDGGQWEVRFPASSSGLDCSFDRYSVDFIAVDAAGESAAVTVYMAADTTPGA